MALVRFARNTILATVAGATSAMGVFVGSIIIARMLGPTGSGTVALAMWLVGTAVTIGDLGLPLTIARFVPDLNARGETRDAENFASAFFRPVILTTLIGVAMCIALYFLRTPVNQIIGAVPFDDEPSSIWLAVALVFALQAIGNFALGAMRGAQRFDLAAKINTASLVVQLIGVPVGAYFFGVNGALAGMASGSLLLAVYALMLIRATAPVSTSLSSRAWTFAMGSWGAGLIAAIVWSRTEIAFLNHWRGAHEAGLYAVANTLAQVATQAPLLMTGGMLALFSERFATGDHEGLDRAFGSAMRFMSFLLFPACFGMAAIVPALLPLLFGPAFEEAVPAASLLVAAQAFGAISTVSSALIFAAERSNFLVRIGVLGAAGIIASGLFIIPEYGLMGAVGTRIIIQIALVLAAFVYVSRILGYYIPTGAILRIIGCAIGSALVARLIVMQWPTVPGVCAAIAAGIVTHLMLARMTHALPDEDLIRITTIAERSPQWLSPVIAPLIQILSR